MKNNDTNTQAQPTPAGDGPQRPQGDAGRETRSGHGSTHDVAASTILNSMVLLILVHKTYVVIPATLRTNGHSYWSEAQRCG